MMSSGNIQLKFVAVDGRTHCDQNRTPPHMNLPYYGPWPDASTYDMFGHTVKAYKAASDRDSSAIPTVDVRRVVVS